MGGAIVKQADLGGEGCRVASSKPNARPRVNGDTAHVDRGHACRCSHCYRTAVLLFKLAANVPKQKRLAWTRIYARARVRVRVRVRVCARVCVVVVVVVGRGGT
jgi:hypothetical protein